MKIRVNKSLFNFRLLFKKKKKTIDNDDYIFKLHLADHSRCHVICYCHSW